MVRTKLIAPLATAGTWKMRLKEKLSTAWAAFHCLAGRIMAHRKSEDCSELLYTEAGKIDFKSPEDEPLTSRSASSSGGHLNTDLDWKVSLQGPGRVKVWKDRNWPSWRLSVPPTALTHRDRNIQPPPRLWGISDPPASRRRLESRKQPNHEVQMGMGCLYKACSFTQQTEPKTLRNRKPKTLKPWAQVRHRIAWVWWEPPRMLQTWVPGMWL